MRTSRSLLFCLFLTAVMIGLVKTDVIEFQNQGIHAQTQEIIDLLARIILDDESSSELEKEQEDLLQNSMLLKNNIDGEVIVVQPYALIMIDDQDIEFQFKVYNPNENSIIVTKGTNLEMEYKLSEINILKLNTVSKKSTPTTEQFIVGGLVGTIVGAIIGFAAEANSKPDTYISSGGLVIGGCALGMFAGPYVLKSLQSSEGWMEIYLAEWSVWSPE